MIGSNLRKYNCKLVNNIASNIIIYGEENKLERVLINIVKNSIDAYKDKRIKGTIEINALEDKENCIISIKDEAGGIPKEIQDTLLKEIKTTKEENGTGFGLYYSNTVIESQFGGNIQFETQENVGTTFYIKIPKKKKEEE